MQRTFWAWLLAGVLLSLTAIPSSVSAQHADSLARVLNTARSQRWLIQAEVPGVIVVGRISALSDSTLVIGRTTARVDSLLSIARSVKKGDNWWKAALVGAMVGALAPRVYEAACRCEFRSEMLGQAMLIGAGAGGAAGAALGAAIDTRQRRWEILWSAF